MYRWSKSDFYPLVGVHWTIERGTIIHYEYHPKRVTSRIAEAQSFGNFGTRVALLEEMRCDDLLVGSMEMIWTNKSWELIIIHRNWRR